MQADFEVVHSIMAEMCVVEREIAAVRAEMSTRVLQVQADLEDVHSSMAEMQAREKRGWKYTKVAIVLCVLSIMVRMLADVL